MPFKTGFKNVLNRVLVSVGLVVFLNGCASVGAMNVPGQTSASARLKSDVLKMIRMIEKAQAPGCSFKVVDTKFVSNVGGSLQEEWIVDSCGKEIIYPVTFTTDPNGGTYFGVKTPDKR